jgi:hypothetical protein
MYLQCHYNRVLGDQLDYRLKRGLDKLIHYLLRDWDNMGMEGCPHQHH